MADCVARSSSWFCSRDGKICCYGDALSTILLLACFCALLPTFRFSFLFSFHTFFPGIPVCLSSSHHLLLSACTYFIVRVNSASVICTLPHLGILLLFLFVQYFFFRSSCFSGSVFFCCALVPGTLALDLRTMILERLIFLCLTFCYHRICISLG